MGRIVGLVLEPKEEPKKAVEQKADKPKKETKKADKPTE